MVNVGGIIAATAGIQAAAHRRRLLMQTEEQTMAAYSRKDLKDGWEFKIVRANTAYFKDYARMQSVIEREKKFGWIFLEKFDDYRMRFKRKKAKADKKPSSPEEDPYRTVYGISTGKIIALAIGLSIAGAGLLVLIPILFVLLGNH